MVGQDGAYSIPLRDGTALWYFGDTLIGKRPQRSLWSIFREPVNGKVEIGPGPFEQMITNTGLVLRNQSGAQGLHDFTYILDHDGRLKKLVPSLPTEDPERTRVWCLHGIQTGEAIYLYYMLIFMHEELAGPSDIGFEIIGSGLAVGNDRDWEFRRLEHEGETLWWTVDQPQFGAVVFHDSPVCSPLDSESRATLGMTEYVYLFGSLQDDRLTHHAYLARVRGAEIAKLARYEYFTGDPDRWSADVHQAVPLFGGQPNEMSVAYNAYLGQYLAVHSMGLSSDIVARTADRPWGPWSEPTTLWSITPPVQGEGPAPSYYAGKEHPELAGEKGRVLYVTYVESNEYFPHLIEVALE